MPMKVTCRVCGVRGDYWDGRFVREYAGRGWVCAKPYECQGRRIEQDRQRRAEQKARLARMADERAARG